MAHDVRTELRALEPIFHRSEAGTPRSRFADMTDEGFWEVGASGRVYSRDAVLAVLEERYGDPHYDPMAGLRLDSFAVRPLGADVWLVTYRLWQDARETRRSTLWRRHGDRWVALYHQGTVVAD